MVQTPEPNLKSQHICEDKTDAKGSLDNPKPSLNAPKIENQAGPYRFGNGQNNNLQAYSNSFSDHSLHKSENVRNKITDWFVEHSDENDKQLISVGQPNYVSNKIEDWCNLSLDETGKSLIPNGPPNNVHNNTDEWRDRPSDDSDKSKVNLEQSDYVSNKIEDWCGRPSGDVDNSLRSEGHSDYVSNSIEDWRDRSSNESDKSHVSLGQQYYVSNKIDDWCNQSSNEIEPHYVSNNINDWRERPSEVLSGVEQCMDYIPNTDGGRMDGTADCEKPMIIRSDQSLTSPSETDGVSIDYVPFDIALSLVNE
jgi:hypothetical protein